MDQFTHAWIAFKAIERLEKAAVTDADPYITGKIAQFFGNYRDGVIQGAWYPDSVFKDNGTAHILKHKPTPDANYIPANLTRLAPGSQLQLAAKKSTLTLAQINYNTKNNLPERCEALAHAVVDNFKIQSREEKGSPLTPTGNHLALTLFALSHYIADGHMPLHCDYRPLGDKGCTIHHNIESAWGNLVKANYKIENLDTSTPDETDDETVSDDSSSVDAGNYARFVYDSDGLPLVSRPDTYKTSLLGKVDAALAARPFTFEYGDSKNVLEYMYSVTHQAYLVSYAYLPLDADLTKFSKKTLEYPNAPLAYEEMSVAVLADAVDSVARVWYRVIRRYHDWCRKSKNKIAI